MGSCTSKVDNRVDQSSFEDTSVKDEDDEGGEAEAVV